MTELAVQEEVQPEEQPKEKLFSETRYATLERHTPEALELKARTLRLTHDKNSAPVNPLRITEGLGIEALICEFKDESVSGAISKREGKCTMYINKNLPQVKKKWVLGHLLGHHQLHLRDRNGNWIDSVESMFYFDPTQNEKALEEAEASRFAAALFIPIDDLLYVWGYADSLLQVAELLDVPLAAVEYRMKRFGLR